MRKSKMGRVHGVSGIAWSALLAVGLVACATATQTVPSGNRGEISDVRVERIDDATTVMLLGLVDPVFTAFEQSNPERIVIDIADVGAANTSRPVVVYDGLVEEVDLSPFGDDGTMTRVEISTAGPARFEVTATDEGLSVRLEAAPDDGLARTDSGLSNEAVDPGDPWASDPWASDSNDDPWAMDSSADASSEDPSSDDDAAWAAVEPDSDSAAGPIAAASPAENLTSVVASEVGGGMLIELAADGSIGNVESFTLENPDRLVIDLPGLASKLTSSPVEVGTAAVQRIRVGQHAGKVRVVVDGGGAADPFEGRRVSPGHTGLWVALGGGSDLDIAIEEATSAAPTLARSEANLQRAAVAAEKSAPKTAISSGADAGADGSGAIAATAASSETASEAVSETFEPAATEQTGAAEAAAVSHGGMATVYGVEFDVQAERDRLVVLGDKPMDYLVYEPDPETLVISIAGAEIEPEAAVRIAPEAGGPVSLVTAFAQPDVETSEVRLVVQRAANLKPVISRRGSLLIVDFPRTGEVAARPPVFETPPAIAASNDAADPLVAAAVVEPGMIDLTGSAPASPAPAAGNIDLSSAPASLEPPASIDVLQEGGLIDGKEYSGRRISLDFKDVEVADVLRLIAEVSDLNVIAGDEVKGEVTIRLVDVPWDQALDIILLTKGLGFMRIGNVLRIAPTDVIAQEEEARLQERRAKERLEDLVVKLQPVNYADAKDIAGMVKQLLTERGTVNVDQRTNTLVLKDIPAVIDEATALVKAIDTQTPQVMIEAKIVEAKLKFSREFGSVWSVGVQPLSDAWDSSSPLRQDIGSDFMRLRPSSTGAPNGAVFANPITTLPTAVANMGAYLLDEKINLDLQLQAAEINGDGKVISSPRVVTMDNSKAKIEQGVSIPFQTFENGDAQLEFVDAVLKLDVTPHITANQAIIMKIKVTRNAPDDSVFTMTGSPAIAKNEVDTETLVKDGQTLVLGGIYTVAKSQRQSRVPYLHRIPILGGAFKNNEISDDRQELLIFVTPRIVQIDQSAS
jgi:type IV pilus assembly protein PilQ